MRATLYAVTHRGFEAGAGLVTLALIGLYFTAAEQGFYYTFVGLLTLQTLVDLGFASVIQQFASHECAHTGTSEPGGSRLAALIRFSLRWYVVAGTLVGLGLWLGGSLYFRTFAGEGLVAWRGVWLAASLLTGASMVLTPALAILEGAGCVDRVYRARLGQSLAGRAAGWLAIASGLGLLVIPVARLAAMLAGLAGLGRSGLRFLLGELKRQDRAQDRVLSWKREMWPLQWRVALSSAGGYVLFSLFTPVLFAARGPEVAGRMGMTLSVAAALSSAAFAFVATRQARLAMLAARREYSAMDAVFRRAAATAVALESLGALTFLVVVDAVPSVGSRFLPLAESALLLLGMLFQQIRFAMASYLRAHKEEPYAGLAVVEAVLAVAVLAPVGSRFGSLGLVVGFLVLSVLALVPAAVIFERRRSQWRRRTEAWVAT